MKTRLHITAALVIAIAASAAQAQATKDSVALANARCEKEVREYLDTLKFIRQSAGAQIGALVAAGYVDEETLRKVQGERGSCTAAQLIREKTARRG